MDFLGQNVLAEANNDGIWKAIEKVVKSSEAYKERTYYGTDLGDFVNNLKKLFTSDESKVQSTCDRILEILNTIEHKSKGGNNGLSGLSIFIPDNKGKEYNAVKNLMPNNWTAFLDRLIDKAPLYENNIFDNKKKTITNNKKQVLLGSFSGNGTHFQINSLILIKIRIMYWF